MTVKDLMDDIYARNKELDFLANDLYKAQVPFVKEYIQNEITTRQKQFNELMASTVSYVVSVPAEIHNAKGEFEEFFEYVSTEPWPQDRECRRCTALIDKSPEFAKSVCVYCKALVIKNETKPVRTVEKKVITSLYPAVFSDATIQKMNEATKAEPVACTNAHSEQVCDDCLMTNCDSRVRTKDCFEVKELIGCKDCNVNSDGELTVTPEEHACGNPTFKKLDCEDCKDCFINDECLEAGGTGNE